MGSQAKPSGLAAVQRSIRSGPGMLTVKAGFTLLELLVSMTLMGLLAVAIHMGFRIGTNAWAKADSRLETLRTGYFSLDLLSRQIGSMVPYYSQQKINDAPVEVLLFQGVPKAMRFVSNFSAQSRGAGGLRLVEYFVSNSRDKGVNALLVNERLLPDDPSLSRFVFRDIFRGDNNAVAVNFFEFRARSDSLYLFQGVEQIQFQYFRPHLANLEGPDNAKEHLPLAIEIQLRWKEAGIFSAQEFSVVVPTHATS
jgi:prepilin-type N-terminal cleavage/methylation domain-containing protein